jgi:ABC transporter substrate binding protein (PQQ-dependent alcohol dehydrogenase system)
MTRLVAVLLALIFCPAAARSAERVVIGYVDLIDDPRHEDRMGFGGIPIEARGRPHDGAALAMDDLAMVGQAIGIEFELASVRAANLQALIGAVEKLRSERGAHFILVDAMTDAVAAVARVTSNVLLFNVSAAADTLRGPDCFAHLMHLIPSTAMMTDALIQYVVARKWRDVLVLEGPDARDADVVRALERSAKRFGAHIVAKRPFLLGSDPRQRDQNNLALLTTGASYDVVFVADESRDFSRFLPYQIMSPRPVIGDAGLTAGAWHWAWDRDGGANVSRRFRRMAQRPMRSEDWAAWVGVKSIVEAVLRTRSTDAAIVTAYLKGGEFRVDGSKGQALSFRSWDNQLRQPVQLATQDAVIAQAPFPQFLHQSENLDTLGADRPDSACRFLPDRS